MGSSNDEWVRQQWMLDPHSQQPRVAVPTPSGVNPQPQMLHYHQNAAPRHDLNRQQLVFDPTQQQRPHLPTNGVVMPSGVSARPHMFSHHENNSLEAQMVGQQTVYPHQPPVMQYSYGQHYVPHVSPPPVAHNLYIPSYLVPHMHGLTVNQAPVVQAVPTVLIPAPNQVDPQVSVNQRAQSAGQSSAGFDMSIADYVSRHCGGSLAESHTPLRGNPVPIAKPEGRRLLCKATRHLIRKFFKGKSWGGKITPTQLRMKNGKKFFIAGQPSARCTPGNLLADLSCMLDSMIVHLKANGATAIYVRHIEKLIKKPPSIVFNSDDAFMRYLNFLWYHPAFSFSMERSDLIKSAGMLFKYAGTDDGVQIVSCLYDAYHRVYPSDAPEFDWRVKADQDPMLSEILWDRVKPADRLNRTFLRRNTPQHLFLFGRNSIEHAPENSLEEEIQPAPTTALGTQAQPNQGALVHPGTGGAKSSAAAASINTSSAQPLPLAGRKGSVTTTGSSTPVSGGINVPQSGTVTQGLAATPSQSLVPATAVQIPATTSAQISVPSHTTIRMIQRMKSPTEVEYVLGLNFDEFFAEGILHLLLEPELDGNRFFHERWAAYTRSVREDDDEGWMSLHEDEEDDE